MSAAPDAAETGGAAAATAASVRAAAERPTAAWPLAAAGAGKNNKKNLKCTLVNTRAKQRIHRAPCLSLLQFLMAVT